MLRDVDTPPAVRTGPAVTSLTATLAAGILAGPAGDQVRTDGDLPGFFANVLRWYGHDPATLAPGVVPGTEAITAGPPPAAQYDLHAAGAQHSEGFLVYVRYTNPNNESYFPDQPAEVAVRGTGVGQLLNGAGLRGPGATLTGPIPAGGGQYLPAGQPLPYSVQFESDPLAAAVRQVRVVTQLNPDLDPRSFRLGDIRVGGLQVHVPAGLGAFQDDFDYSRSRGFFLRVSAGLDLGTATATWLLQAIDPPPESYSQTPRAACWRPAARSAAAPGPSGTPSCRDRVPPPGRR